MENDITVTLMSTRYYLRLSFIRFNILYDCDFSVIFLRKLHRFVLFNEGSIDDLTPHRIVLARQTSWNEQMKQIINKIYFFISQKNFE